MQAASCTSPEQVICPTKFINETQLTTLRNYCTPSITSYKTTVYLQLQAAAPFWFSSVTSHQYCQRVTFQQTDLVTYRGKTDGAKVPLLVLQEAQLWFGLLPTMATSRTQTLPSTWSLQLQGQGQEGGLSYTNG